MNCENAAYGFSWPSVHHPASTFGALAGAVSASASACELLDDLLVL